MLVNEPWCTTFQGIFVLASLCSSLRDELPAMSEDEEVSDTHTPYTSQTESSQWLSSEHGATIRSTHSCIAKVHGLMDEK
jgi:hypothetical protein